MQSYSEMSNQEEPSVDRLQQKARLEPQPFTSNVPLLGSLIVWVCRTWNSVATRWYVAPLIQQQNEFNQGVVDELRLLRADMQSTLSELHNISIAQQELRQLCDEISDRLIILDRDVGVLTHDLGKVTYAVIRQDEEMKRIGSSLLR